VLFQGILHFLQASGLKQASAQSIRKHVDFPLIPEYNEENMPKKYLSSRHHWGTDIDIYSLNNVDFLSGEGRDIYKWTFCINKY